jgi:hypothetical protein
VSRIPAEALDPPSQVKSKYTSERVERILASLKNGNPRFVAAAKGGISVMTLRNWLKDKPEFEQAVLEAESSAVSAHIGNINRAAIQNGNWQASAWWLERRYPQEFGRVDRLEVYQREMQARQIAQELTEELGREVTPEEVLKEAENLSRKALPPPKSKRP